MLDFWPLKNILAATWTPTYFFRDASKSTQINNRSRITMGASNCGHSMVAFWLPQLIKSNIWWFLLDLCSLEYLCTNMDPNLFLQECKQQYWDKLNDMKIPWVLVGAANNKHIKSHILLHEPLSGLLFAAHCCREREFFAHSIEDNLDLETFSSEGSYHYTMVPLQLCHFVCASKMCERERERGEGRERERRKRLYIP